MRAVYKIYILVLKQHSVTRTVAHKVPQRHIPNRCGSFFLGQMRFLIIILTTVTSIAFGQSSKVTMHCERVLDPLTNREIYNTVDIPASPHGGLSKLYSELGTINIPKDPDITKLKFISPLLLNQTGTSRS